MNLSISAPGHDYEASPSNGWPNGNNQRIHSLTNPCILTKRISGPPNQLTEQIKANTCWTNRYAYQCRKNWVTKFKWKIIFALSNVHRFYSAIQARGGNFVCVYMYVCDVMDHTFFLHFSFFSLLSPIVLEWARTRSSGEQRRTGEHRRWLATSACSTISLVKLFII